ncbi:Ca2+-binding RTX toxin-like protein [Rhodobacter sp. JA431]|uniref:Hint domain-containing protein n=1 Tax=Rhodobacter sp. JA431 TaxID=570013 RepID=UPI000BCE233E|nr:Hint domain-containing protein [Rhodobacter sp. JA431]SOB90168.1 Ca2+-binding RTX toxin-like protein [Rhodobacter sp. JA431]
MRRDGLGAGDLATYTIQGFYGAQILIEGGGSSLTTGSNFMIDPTWDYDTSRRTFVIEDEGTNLEGDNLNNEVGNDSTQNATVYDATGTQLFSGQVYAEWAAEFTAPDGSTITMYVLEINGTVVGEITSAPLVPGVTYHVTATPDVTDGPTYTSLASMSFDPDAANNIQGGDYNDSILAGAGNDTINTGAGSDTIDGGSGNDSIEYGTGGDEVHGGDGNDYIDDYAGSTGYVWNDTIYGDAGNDTIYSGHGNDYVDGGADNDTIFGEDGNDTLLGGTGNDWIEGGGGADSIDGGAGADVIIAGDANDTVRGGDGADSMAGDYGDDVLYGDADADRFYFEANWGHDTVYGGNTTTAGGSDYDTLDFSYFSGVAGVSVIYSGSEDGNVTQGSNTITFYDIEGIYGSSLGDTINASADSSGLTLDGAAGNDSIIGGSSHDLILGGTGDDTIYSGLGNDTVYGGDGNDYIDDLSGVRAETYANYVDAGTGNDTVFTGGGSDTIYGGAGDDQLHAEAGDDLVYGDAGNDTIDGGDGNDTIYGGDGDDSVWANTGDDYVDGGAGNDTLHGAAGDDTLTGGTGLNELHGDDDADTFLLNFGDGATSIYGGEGGTDSDTIILSGAGATVTWTGWETGTITYDGDPTVHYFWEIEKVVGTDLADSFDASSALDGVDVDAGGGSDVIIGSDFGDSISTGSGADTVTGGDGNDTILTVSGNDVVDGGAGDDSIHGGTGNTTLSGGDGNDTLVAGSGSNDMSGGVGDDLLIGSTTTGADTLDGGDGNDTIQAGQGANSILGGSGDDSISTGDGNDTVDGGSGADTIVAGAGANEISGGDGNDSITGGSDAETLSGDAGNDTISGGTGNDLIWGGADGDALYGDDGDDTLIGGTGSDTLTGGTGADTYVFSDGDGADFIADFDMSVVGGLTTDQLDVSALQDLSANPVNTWDVTVGDDGSGNAVLGFPDGTTVTLLGVSPASVSSAPVLHAMGIPCLVAGTRVATPGGMVPVELLKPGDLVNTRAGPPMPVLWAGKRHVCPKTMQNNPKLLPVEISAGRLGNARPVRLSALHGVYVPEGPDGALARAGHMAACGWGGARQMRGVVRHDEGVSYHHLLLPHHALISAEGLWVESFWPGKQGLKGLDQAARMRLIRALPRLARVVWAGEPVEKVYSAPAARFLKRRQIDRLVCANWSRITCKMAHFDGFVTEPVASARAL